MEWSRADDSLETYGAKVTQDGNEVGIVRSPCQSPSFGMEVIAMGIVDRGLATEGSKVDVALGRGTVPATVATFPIYDTAKRRPRS